MNQEDLVQLQTLLGSGQNILILTGKNPTLDSLGASLALYLAFYRSGKAVTVACPQAPTVDLANLVGIDKVRNELGGQNLVVSFPYTEGSIEKVSYNIEGDKFNLVIQPQAGVQPLSPGAVKFSHGGVGADLIFILGVKDLADLGQIYEKEKDLYNKIPLVAIDYHSENNLQGQVNFIDPHASSVSEIVGLILAKLGINLDPDIAHNLLVGLDFATQNFSLPSTSAGAFELAAACLKSGARRRTEPLSKPVPQVAEEKVAARSSLGISTPKIVKDQTEEAPPDWLTPKIFRGSDLP